MISYQSLLYIATAMYDRNRYANLNVVIKVKLVRTRTDIQLWPSTSLLECCSLDQTSENKG